MNKILSKYKNLSIQAKASLWFIVCSILQRGISLITVPLFTRMMSPEEYGYYSNYISWFSIILVFSSLSLYYGVFNNAMVKFDKDRDRYISSMQGLTFTLSAGLFVLYFLLRNHINSLLGMPTILVLLMFLELVVYPSMQFWTARNRFDYKYKKIVAVTLAEYILNPVLGIFLVTCSDDKGVARILSIVITEVLFYGAITIFQYYKGRAFFVKQYWKYALLFNIPLLPHYLSGQILSQSDRVMIKQFIDYSSVAKYSVAYNIGILMNIIVTAINGSYTPWFYNSIKEKKYSKIRGVSSTISYIMAFLVAGLMLFGPEIIYVIAPRDYKDAVYVIPPVAASVFFTFVYNIFANVEFYFEKNKFVMYGSLASAVMNLILNYIFIPIYGYIAAAYTTLFCYIIYAYMHFSFSSFVRREKGINEALFGKKTMIFLTLIVVGEVVIVSMLYPYSFLRYIVIVSLLSASIIFRKKIAKQFRKILLLKTEK